MMVLLLKRPMDIVIQSATLDLADSFRRTLDVVARERRYLIFLEAPPLESIRKFVEKLLAGGGSQFYAVCDGQVVGWCDLWRDERPGMTHVGHLGMGLLPEYRGQKLGARLLAAAVADAFRKGIGRIELEVFASNARAIALYRKFGFVEEGRKRQARCLDGVCEDTLCMAMLKPDISSGARNDLSRPSSP